MKKIDEVAKGTVFNLFVLMIDEVAKSTVFNLFILIE